MSKPPAGPTVARCAVFRDAPELAFAAANDSRRPPTGAAALPPARGGSEWALLPAESTSRVVVAALGGVLGGARLLGFSVLGGTPGAPPAPASPARAPPPWCATEPRVLAEWPASLWVVEVARAAFSWEASSTVDWVALEEALAFCITLTRFRKPTFDSCAPAWVSSLLARRSPSPTKLVATVSHAAPPASRWASKRSSWLPRRSV
mmetsp:Transcript_18455/g.47321  ORF Transcript_18455/g.47321 Transcript_18455/m.47321 type:complete len:206 (-) Transcript_18455:225-842(-)